MFEVGFSELLLIFALALIVLGPERLPKLAQQVGRWVGRARAMARQFRDQLEEEAHNLETKVNIDPGIDTSLDPKPAAPAPPATPVEPQAARALFGEFVTAARTRHGDVATGEFGAHMQVSLVNDGPVTFWLRTAPDDKDLTDAPQA